MKLNPLQIRYHSHQEGVRYSTSEISPWLINQAGKAVQFGNLGGIHIQGEGKLCRMSCTILLVVLSPLFGSSEVRLSQGSNILRSDLVLPDFTTLSWGHVGRKIYKEQVRMNNK